MPAFLSEDCRVNKRSQPARYQAMPSQDHGDFGIKNTACKLACYAVPDISGTQQVGAEPVPRRESKAEVVEEYS